MLRSIRRASLLRSVLPQWKRSIASLRPSMSTLFRRCYRMAGRASSNARSVEVSTSPRSRTPLESALVVYERTVGSPSYRCLK